MTLANATKKLTAAGFTLTETGGEYNRTIVAIHPSRPRHCLRALSQGGDVIVISTGYIEDESDVRSYWNTLTQAIRHFLAPIV